MANTTSLDKIRGLILSAVELRELTDWPDAVIEEFLTLFDNLTLIAEVADKKQDILRTVIDVTSSESPYDILDVDQTIVFDTTAGDITATLPIGINGRTYRMTNIGTGGNKVIIIPDGTTLFGDVSENMYDAETLDLTFQDDSGWW